MNRVWAMAMLVVALWPVGGYGQTSTSFTFHSGATSVVNGNAMSAANFSTIAVQVEGVGGAFVGTVQFEKKTKDAAGYVAVQCTNAGDRTQIATSTDAPGYWECPGGAYLFRVPVTARTSGTIKVTGMGTTAVAGRGSSGGAQGLDNNFDIQPSINGATVSKPLRFGDGVFDVCAYGSSTLGPVIKPCNDSDTRAFAWTNFNWRLFDIEGDKDMIVADPDAFGTGSGTVTLQTGEQLVASNLGVKFTDSDTNPSCASGSYGIWADASDDTLVFCNDGKVRSFETIVVKPSDESVTASITLQADNDLVYPVAANGLYEAEYFLLYNSPTAADFQYDFTLPSGSSGYKSSIASPISTTGCSDTTSAITNNSMTQVNNNVGGAGSVCSLRISTMVLVGGTGGTVVLRWAQATSDAGNTTVLAKSVMRYRKVS